MKVVHIVLDVIMIICCLLAIASGSKNLDNYITVYGLQVIAVLDFLRTIVNRNRSKQARAD